MIKKGLESVNDTKVFTFVWTEMHTKNIKAGLIFFFIRRKAVRSTIGHNRTRIFISVSFFDYKGRERKMLGKKSP